MTDNLSIVSYDQQLLDKLASIVYRLKDRGAKGFAESILAWCKEHPESTLSQCQIQVISEILNESKHEYHRRY